MTKNTQKHLNIATITWLDACYYGKVKTNKEEVAKNAKLTRLTDTGYLIYKEDDRVMLASQINEDGSFSRIMVIPTSCIEKIDLVGNQETIPDKTEQVD